MRASRYRAESGCCTGIVPDSGGFSERQIHGVPEEFLTPITTISNAGPSGEPARLMRQLHLHA